MWHEAADKEFMGLFHSHIWVRRVKPCQADLCFHYHLNHAEWCWAGPEIAPLRRKVKVCPTSRLQGCLAPTVSLRWPPVSHLNKCCKTQLIPLKETRDHRVFKVNSCSTLNTLLCLQFQASAVFYHFITQLFHEWLLIKPNIFLM